jgi:hypothetical protein
MDRTFACPECGNEVALKGLSPGRQVRCGWCNTWVEVPFLPRSVRSPSRSGRRRPAWAPWAWAALAIVGLLIVALGVRHSARVRVRKEFERTLSELTAAAAADEEAGRFEQAVAGYDQAIREAGRGESPGSPRAADLRGRRDRAARRWAQDRLSAASAQAATDPAGAVSAGQTLLDRVRRDRALKDFEGEVQDLMERARGRQAELSVAAAHRAFDDGRFGEALGFCDRTVATAGYLDSATSHRLRQDVDAMAAEIIGRRGVVLAPTTGEFTFGSPRDADHTLHPPLADALRKHGYVPRPSSSPWLPLWDERAPYRVDITVTESLGPLYMHSRNRVSIILVQIKMSHKGTLIWSEGPIVARTSSQVPKLPAYLAGRVALDGPRTAEYERLLYQEAHAKMVQSFTARLGKVPDPSPTAPGASPSS